MSSVSEFSPSVSMDRALRRFHPKHVLSEQHRPLAAFFAVMLLLLGSFLVVGGSVVALAAITLSFTMLSTRLYKALGGVLRRRSAKEQGHWLCEAALGDPICDFLDYVAAQRKRSLIASIAVLHAVGVLGCYVSMGSMLMLCGAALLLAVIAPILKQKRNAYVCQSTTIQDGRPSK